LTAAVRPNPPSSYTGVVAQLVREQAARGVPFRFRVTSGSMAPLIEAGDEVVIRAAQPPALRPDDLVLVDAGGLFVLHRLRAVLPDGRLVTHGDRNLDPDRPWTPDELVGQAVAVVRGGQTRDLLAGPGRTSVLRLGRLARVEQACYRAARAAKRAVAGERSLGVLSVAATRILRSPFAWLSHLLK
jgi:hypothetical protein